MNCAAPASPPPPKSTRKPATAGIGNAPEKLNGVASLVSRKGSGAFLCFERKDFTTEDAEVHRVRGGASCVTEMVSAIAVGLTCCHGPSAPWPTFAQSEPREKIGHSGRDDDKCKPAAPTP